MHPSLRHLLTKLAALFSFCGGPLVLCDVLKPRIGVGMAVVVTFAPILFMLLMADELFDGPPVRSAVQDPAPKRGVRWGILFMRLALVGALATLLMHGLGAWILATNVPRPDGGLTWFGIVVGIPIAAAYAYFATRWLDRAAPPADPFAPIEPR